MFVLMSKEREKGRKNERKKERKTERIKRKNGRKKSVWLTCGYIIWRIYWFFPPKLYLNCR